MCSPFTLILIEYRCVRSVVVLCAASQAPAQSTGRSFTHVFSKTKSPPVADGLVSAPVVLSTCADVIPSVPRPGMVIHRPDILFYLHASSIAHLSSLQFHALVGYGGCTNQYSPPEIIPEGSATASPARWQWRMLQHSVMALPDLSTRPHHAEQTDRCPDWRRALPSSDGNRAPTAL